MKEIINRLESKIEDIRRIGQDMDEAGWGTEEGVLITGNEAQKILDFIGAGSGQINTDVISRLNERWELEEKEMMKEMRFLREHNFKHEESYKREIRDALQDRRFELKRILEGL